MATVFGMALGGWMSGAIFDLTGSYRVAFANGLIWNAINVLIMLWLLVKGSLGTHRGHKTGRQPFPATWLGVARTSV